MMCIYIFLEYGTKDKIEIQFKDIIENVDF